MKKVKTLEMNSIVESSALGVRADQQKVLQNEASRESVASRDDDDLYTQLQ